jgi:peptide deformylase
MASEENAKDVATLNTLLQKIVTVGHPALHTPTQLVQFPPSDAVMKTVADLHEILMAFRKVNGFGRAIAANQIGASCSIIAAFLPGEGSLTLFNPRITWKSAETLTMWDDCFSFPEMLVRVSRHQHISIAFEDEKGVTQVRENLPVDLSELFQHEIDHLLGLTSFDRISPSEPQWCHARETHVATGVPPVVMRTHYLANRDYYNAFVSYFPAVIMHGL